MLVLMRSYANSPIDDFGTKEVTIHNANFANEQMARILPVFIREIRQFAAFALEEIETAVQEIAMR